MIASGRPGQWARALHRAEAYNLIVVPIETRQDGHNVTHFYKARSVSRPDSVIHGIRIECTAAGVDVKCSCEGSQKSCPCMHAAQCLRAAGRLSDLLLIEAGETAAAA